MRKSTVSAVMIATLVAAPGGVSAQIVVESSRLRVRTADSKSVGTLTEKTERQLTLRLENGSVIQVPLMDVERLDMSLGKKENGGKGAVFGLGLAQDAAALRPGMHLRVTAAAQLGKPIVGTLMAAEPTVLIIRTSEERVEVRRDAIEKLEWRERRGSKRKGATIGGLVGAGAIAALLIYQCSSDWGCEDSDAGRIAILLGGTAAIGAGIGAAVAPGERWVELRSPLMGTDQRRSSRGLRATFTIRF